MVSPLNEILPFSWDGNGWTRSGGVGTKEVAPGRSFRLSTMNILHDKNASYVELAIASQRRFERLVTEIEVLDATVLGLNEVSRTSLEVLLSSGFIRQNYYVSELPDNANGTLNGPHGCVLFSKLPFDKCYAIDAEGLQSRKPVVGVVQWSGKPISICSLHTVAHQTKRNMALRAKQIGNVASCLQPLNVAAHFIIGDLNMHQPAEDAVIGANGLLDVWAETHFGIDGDNDPGFTFDASTNSMIPRYIPGEARKMRLDRILCFKGDALVPASSCAFWGHEAVDASADVFLSDHYGLFIDLKLAASGFEGCADVHAILEANGRTNFNEYSLVPGRFAVALVFHSGWLAQRLVGLK